MEGEGRDEPSEVTEEERACSEVPATMGEGEGEGREFSIAVRGAEGLGREVSIKT